VGREGRRQEFRRGTGRATSGRPLIGRRVRLAVGRLPAQHQGQPNSYVPRERGAQAPR
jgi:hypothetical protein